MSRTLAKLGYPARHRALGTDDVTASIVRGRRRGIGHFQSIATVSGSKIGELFLAGSKVTTIRASTILRVAVRLRLRKATTGSGADASATSWEARAAVASLRSITPISASAV